MWSPDGGSADRPSRAAQGDAASTEQPPQVTERSAMAGKLGRLAPHPETDRPRLKLGQFLTAAAYPAAPDTVDYISQVDSWPMYGNDRLGDCTCAAAGHMIEAWTRYGQGTTIKVTDQDVLTTYEKVGGYDPRDPDSDQGAVMQDVLDYWRKTGIAGHKILAFAEVDVRSAGELAAAMYLFGHVYLGINCPDSAMNQFDAGKPWDVVRGAQVEGGHAIDWGFRSKGRNHKVITWGQPQEMTAAFFAKYVEEAWVVVDDRWLSAAGTSPEGLDVAALNSAFTELTGQPAPFPVRPQPSPTPVPVPPAPGPAPSAADQALAGAMRTWLTATGL
jgi:hypothetical protein